MDEQPESFDAVIIGAGISGLIAAYDLHKKGKKVLIIEKTSRVGGCLFSSTKEGFTLEHGANTLVLTPRIQSLLEELHLIAQVKEPAFKPFRQYVWSIKHSAPREVPRSPKALFLSDLFSLTEKSRLIVGLFKKTSVSNESTVSQLFSSLLGSPIVERAMAPALRGIFGGDLTKLKIAAVFPKIAAHLQNGGSLFSYAKLLKSRGRKIFHLSGGNAQITDALALLLSNNIRKEIEVTQIAKVDHEFLVTLKNNSQSSVIKTKELYFAISGEALSQIVATSFETTLPIQRFAPITVLHFAYNSKQPLLKEAFGILFPKNTPFSSIGILFNSDLFPHASPKDQSLLTVCRGGIDSKDESDISDEDLIALSKNELKEIFTIPENLLSSLAVTRWKHAIPQYEDHFFELNEKFASLEKQFPGLHFIGVDRGAVGVPDRIERVLETKLNS